MQTKPSIRSPQNSYLLSGLVILGTVAILMTVFILMAQRLPVGVDYYTSYRRAAEKWIDGETNLYYDPDFVFYNAPWSVFLFAVISLPSPQVSLALLNTLSLIGIMGCIYIWQNQWPVPRYAPVLAVLNLYTVDLLVRGQIDTFVLGGMVSGWWAIQNHRPVWLSVAIALLVIKPLNIILVGILFLIAIYKWSWRDYIVVASVPAILSVLSSLLISVDWPIQYFQYSRENRPFDGFNSTIWKASSQFNIPFAPFIVIAIIAVIIFIFWAIRLGNTQWTVSIAIATNLVFTTYANGNHYILLVPVFLFLSRYNGRLAVIAYLTTFTPLLRLFWGLDITWVDIAYPVILLLGLWYYRPRDVQQPLIPSISPLSPSAS